jgi:hypothetical protein
VCWLSQLGCSLCQPVSGLARCQLDVVQISHYSRLESPYYPWLGSYPKLYISSLASDHIVQAGGCPRCTSWRNRFKSAVQQRAHHVAMDDSRHSSNLAPCAVL